MTAEAARRSFWSETEFLAIADNQGKYSFSNVPLEPGVNTFTARSTLGTVERDFTRRIIRDREPTLASPIANFSVPMNSPTTIFNLPTIFSDADVNTLVRFTTSSGAFDVELFDQLAPNTVANFISYFSRYGTTIFHRNTGNVLQGGQFAFDVDQGDSSLTPIDADPAIGGEPGMSNQVGTIAMAPAQSNATQQQNQFFFNLVDNSGGTPNFDTVNGGITAFGGAARQRLTGHQRIGGDPGPGPGRRFLADPAAELSGPARRGFPHRLVGAEYGVNQRCCGDSQRGPAQRRRPGVFGGQQFKPESGGADHHGRPAAAELYRGSDGDATIVIRATDAEGHFIEASFTVTVTA